MTENRSNSSEVIIIGAGLTGLSAAVALKKAGIAVRVLEKSDRPGGKMKTDEVKGFKLDRGFQVFLTAYPEAIRILHYDQLALRRFRPGAWILQNGKKVAMYDPFREADKWFSMLFFPFAGMADKWRLWMMRQKLKRMSYEQIFSQFEVKSSSILHKRGFSRTFVNAFFKPFFSGIFLDAELKTSRRMLDFVFKMMAEGNIAVPARGIEAIPAQLAARLDPNELILGSEVVKLEEQRVLTADGKSWHAPLIVIATEGRSALLQNLTYREMPEYLGTTTLYFGSDTTTGLGSMLALISGKDNLVNHLIELSAVAPELAPEGKHLISVSINGVPEFTDEELERRVRKEIQPYTDTQSWELLRIYRIPEALPVQQSVLGDVKPGRFAFKDGVYVCGDFHLYGSQNAALRMGKTIAEHIIHQKIAQGKR